MSNKKINIYTYNDFRKFLADYFANRRRQMYAFSIRYFAKKAGIASHSFISAVINGKRNLTHENKRKIARGMGLEPNETRYFHLLVDFNQAKQAEEKQAFFDQLNLLRRNTSYYKLNKNHFEYLSKWYYFVIRELATCTSWGNDYARLASLVIPQITPAEAKAAVKLLLDIRFLVQNSDGTYTQTEKVLTTKEMPGHLVRQVRKQFIELSAHASDKIDPEVRNLGSATVTLTQGNYQKAVEILEEARQKIIALSVDEGPVHRVYQAHTHLFPLSCPLDIGEES